jgi:hypothetical protein
MTRQASIRPYLNQAYLLGLMMMAVGLTLSPFLMGMANFWLVLVWIVDAVVPARHCGLDPQSPKGRGFKSKFSRFWHNKAAVLLVAFYLMHVVGLLWTTDFQYALKDLRVKLPILVLPLILSGMEPLDRKRFHLVMLVYVLSTFVATVFSSVSYWRHDYEDIREISHFISHIRFCLNIVFCIAVICWYLVKSKVTINRFLLFFLLLWFIYQIYIFESLSGYVILAAVVAVTLVFALLRWRKGKVWAVAIGIMAAVAVLSGVVVLQQAVEPLLNVEPVDFSTLESETALGNPYWHDTVYNPVEDGKFVGLYYCKTEMQEAWSERSTMPFEGTTTNGESLEATLARYLTSKDLRKDAEGVKALTDEDIHNIEQGVANYNNWKHPGLRARLSSTLFEYNLYRRFNNPNGGSLSQRIEFTRASFHLIGQHPWFGVGTGDVPQAFSRAYDELQSPLNEEHRFRAHNQYLAIAVAFGLVGLAFFLFVLLYPWCASRKRRTYLYTVFIVIMTLSMLAEDTLETQAGASLFAFFEALLFLPIPLIMKQKNR